MKLFWLVVLTMTAFAFNSILNRLALAPGDTGPASYAAIRLVAGAITLALLVQLRAQVWPQITKKTFWSASMLTLYAIGFSFAYITLPTGVGALILFGGVQVISFAVARVKGQGIGVLSWFGAVLAFAGLSYLCWPDENAPIDPLGAALMLAAAFGWAFYTMAGARNADPLGATALAFILAAPVGVFVWLILPDTASANGIFLAIISGGVTSGMGYAAWYKVLPQISIPTAAVAQLTVPVIAAVGGAAFLGETLTARFLIATVIVLCGVGLVIYEQSSRK